jgi:DNA-binding transcriptional LysR family regulator
VLQAAKTIQLLALPNGEPAGEFRLGIAPGLADVVLSEPLDRLRRRFTALRPSITTAWTAELVENVRSGVLHAAIVLWLNDLTIPTNQTTVVGREDIVVVAARTRPLKKRLTIRDLAAEPWILNPVGCGYRRNLERALEAAGLPLLIAAEATGRDLQLSLIARDLGIGLIPRRIFDQSRYRTKIRALQVRDFRLQSRITVVTGDHIGPLTLATETLAGDVKGALMVKPNQ